jgi:hypothetical protein
MVLPFQVKGLPRGFNVPRSQAVPVPSPPVPTGRGVAPLNSLILSVQEDNFIDPRRTVSLPLQMGDRVMSPFRQGPEGFGGFVLGFTPLTNGAIVLWDDGRVTYDPVSELQPQSRRAPEVVERRRARSVQEPGVGGGMRGGTRVIGVNYP